MGERLSVVAVGEDTDAGIPERFRDIALAVAYESQLRALVGDSLSEGRNLRIDRRGVTVQLIRRMAIMAMRQIN